MNIEKILCKIKEALEEIVCVQYTEGRGMYARR